MRVIIAGSRTITNYNKFLIGITQALMQQPSLFDAPVEIISGGARGVDSLAIRLATESKTKYSIYPADWKQHGKLAGYKRNVVMAENADALIAIWDGKSPGTKHMIDIATKKGLVVVVVRV